MSTTPRQARAGIASARRIRLRIALLLVVGTAIVISPVPDTVLASRASADLHSVDAAPSRVASRHQATGIADAQLAALVAAHAQGRVLPTRGPVRVRNGRVLIEVLHGLGSEALGRALARVDARLDAEVDPHLAVAWVPIERVSELSTQHGIELVRLPLQVSVPQGQPAAPAVGAATGSYGLESVTKSRASAWQNAGWSGAGVRIGIIDTFNGTAWNAASAAGELPAGVSGTRCRSYGATCNIWGGGIHGVAVAEVIKDQAPGAGLYLASATSVADLQAAVNFFDANGVDIITRSETALYDGPGNGTGAVAGVIASAVSKGMAWFNSAGNSGGTSANPGAYWRGSWRDANGNRWLDFTTGGDELLAFDCSFINGLRWSDWGTNRTDYDVYIFNTPTSSTAESVSDDDQAAGAYPLEHPGCGGPQGDIDYLAVWRYSSGSGTAGDILEFMTNGASIEYWQNPYSATGPAADTKSAGAMSLGAIDPVNGTTIAPYSARGPTNDGRIKPNMSAASNMSSYTYWTYQSRGFAGTSASTPVTAGGAALVLDAYPATTPAQLMSWLQTYAFVDRGVAGRDNTYGYGEFRLPAAP